MLSRASSLRFSAFTQMSPDGRSSGSVRSAPAATPWPWNSRTNEQRRFFFFPAVATEHILILPLVSLLRTPRAASMRARARCRLDAADDFFFVWLGLLALLFVALAS